MYEYLLEKSRVVQQGPGEQNFHVFYLFFAGLNPEQREKYQLADPSAHRYAFYIPSTTKTMDTCSSHSFLHS